VVTPYGAGGYGVSFVNEPSLAAEATLHELQP
jgi:hypothetical protein